MSSLGVTLFRELVDCERDALSRTTLEAERLGHAPPGDAMWAIAEHAVALQPRLALHDDRRAPSAIRGLLRDLRASLRHAKNARFVRAERSYRDTLLVLRRGLDVARLLAPIALADAQLSLERWCDRMVRERQPLIEAADGCLAWFAANRGVALEFRAARP